MQVEGKIHGWFSWLSSVSLAGGYEKWEVLRYSLLQILSTAVQAGACVGVQAQSAEDMQQVYQIFTVTQSL